MDVDCPYACGERVQRRSLEEHKSQRCPLRPFTCQYCNHKATHQEVTKEHWSVCEKYPLPCPYKCGEEEIERQHLKGHLEQTCPLQVIQCDFSCAGCGAQLQRRLMSAHMKEGMEAHLSLLSLVVPKLQTVVQQQTDKIDQMVYGMKRDRNQIKEWGDQIKEDLRDQIKQQTDQIKQDRDQINQQGDQIKQQEDQIKRLEDQIKQERYLTKQQGDQIKQQGDQIKQQMKQIQAYQIKEQKDQIKQQRDQIKQQGDQMKQMADLMKQQEDQIKKQKYLIKQKGDQIMQQGGQFRIKHALMEQLQIVPPVDIIMDDFGTHKKSNDKWYSPPFYTHLGGYRMCLSAYANGSGGGKGTHTCVCVCSPDERRV